MSDDPGPSVVIRLLWCARCSELTWHDRDGDGGSTCQNCGTRR